MKRSKTTTCGDGELLDAVLARDARAWRELVRRYESTLRDAIFDSVIGEREFTETEIDDVLGDFWLLVLEDDLRRLRGFRGDDLAGWLSMFASQVAVNRLRRLARQPVMESLEAAENVPALTSPQLLTSASVIAYCCFKFSN